MVQNIRKWLFALIFILITASVVCFSAAAESAYAYTSIKLKNITYTDANGTEGCEYPLGEFFYARKITLHYEIAYPEYAVQEFNSAGGLLRQTQVFPTSNGEATYTVIGSGELNIVMQAYSGGSPVGGQSLSTVVYSDNTAPETATLNEMTNWQMHSAGFIVMVSAIGADAHSGISRAEIIVDGKKRSELTESTGLTDSFTIDAECTVMAVVYDNAGNYSSVERIYNKFDSQPPSAPQISAAPNVDFDTGGGFAREYVVTLIYGSDNLSGVKQGSMVYYLNGELRSFNGAFALNESKKYEIRALYTDMAGNVSPESVLTITNIDRGDPYIEHAELIIDIRKEIPFSIRLKSGDLLSGLKSLSIEGNIAQFKPLTEGFYVAELATLYTSSLRVTARDKVGNFTTSVIPVYHLSDVYFEERVMGLHLAFLSLNETDYNKDAWTKLNKSLAELNLMLVSESTSAWELNTKFSDIDNQIKGDLTKRYIIQSVPKGISLNLDYTLDEKQITERKKGDIFTLAINDVAASEIAALKNTAAGLSAFPSENAYPFILDFLLNGAAFDRSLEKGLSVSMAVPQEFQSRYVKVIDLNENKVIDSSVINNLIQFNVKKAGKYAIVFDKGLPAPKEAKYIKVFDKHISYAAFFGSLGGALGAMAVAITVLTLLRKKGIKVRARPPK